MQRLCGGEAPRPGSSEGVPWSTQLPSPPQCRQFSCKGLRRLFRKNISAPFPCRKTFLTEWQVPQAIRQDRI